MSTKRAWCLSQRGFVTYCRQRGWKQLGVEPDEAVISICCNPDVSSKVLGGYDYHYLKPSENVLDVEWDDITSDEETFLGTDIDGYDQVTAYGITPDTARQVVDFIEKHRGMDFVVHCNAGKSRSQAVIRYITEFYPEHSETNPDNPCLYPNVHTYTALKNARQELGL